MSDAPRPLPRRPSLEQLRKQAKELARATRVPLHEAQYDLARQYGFQSWPKLVRYVATMNESEPFALVPESSFYRFDRATNSLMIGGHLSPALADTVAGVMREHGITGIRAGFVSDDALKRICSAGLELKRIIGSGFITDAGMMCLADAPHLEELELNGLRTITDNGLTVLRHLRRLRRFQLCWTQGISDAGAANLTFCDELEDVDLMGTPTGDGVINALTDKKRLLRLKTGKLVTNRGLPLLQRIPGFVKRTGGEPQFDLMAFTALPTHLLLDGPFTDDGLAALAGLDGLAGLSFFWHARAITPAGLAVLGNLESLTFLGCEGALCNDEAMRQIGALPGLRMLMAQGTVATDAGFAALCRAQALEYLWGRECPNLRDRGLAALSQLPNLKGLGVSLKHVGDRALAALPSFPALTELMPMDVDDAGFRHVGQCERLEKLYCMYCRDTGDAATEHLRGLTGLKKYYAGATKITDRSLEQLAELYSLEEIELWDVRAVTDAGITALARLPRLRTVSIAKSPSVSRGVRAAFSESVDVQIE